MMPLRDLEPATDADPVHPPRPPFTVREVALHALDAEDWIAWWELGTAAGDANLFAAPWFVATGLAHLDPARAVRLLVVVDSARRWLGVLPVVPRRALGRWPLAHRQAWTHSNQFLGLPLMRSGGERAFWEAILAHLDAAPVPAAALRLPDMPVDAPGTTALLQLARDQDRPVVRLDTRRRAVRSGTRDAPPRPGGKRAARLRSLHRQLERDHGPVRVQRCGDADPAEWIARFLAMEQSGWKGAAGSAIAVAQPVSTFFRDSVTAAYAAGRCDLVSLHAGSAEIAMSIQFVGAGHAFGFKRCYDPRFARYAPGKLLLGAVDRLADAGPPRLFDSCCAPDEASVNALWRERREIVDLAIATGPAGSRARFAAIVAARAAWQALKALVRRTPARPDAGIDVERDG